MTRREKRELGPPTSPPTPLTHKRTDQTHAKSTVILSLLGRCVGEHQNGAVHIRLLMPSWESDDGQRLTTTCHENEASCLDCSLLGGEKSYLNYLYIHSIYKATTILTNKAHRHTNEWLNWGFFSWVSCTIGILQSPLSAVWGGGSCRPRLPAPGFNPRSPAFLFYQFTLK